MEPVRVSVDVPNHREEVFDFLDVMANHEPFTNHMLVDWEYAGPARGIGARARVRVRAAGRIDVVDIEVVSAEPPARIVERNVGANGRRHGSGTYTLEELAGGGTRIVFEYAWHQAPLGERLVAPLTRAVMRRGNERSMRRLAEQLGARQGGGTGT